MLDETQSAPAARSAHRMVMVLAFVLTVAGGSVCNADEGAAEPDVLFTDVTEASGIDFIETIGDDEMTNIVEASSVGCGFLDYDGDGWLDIYFVNGYWKEGLSDPELKPEERKKLAQATDHLYRNRGDGTFENVTHQAGLVMQGYGMGVVVCDYDADGDADIYVANYGPNFLFRNNGDGTFTEVAEASGVEDPSFSVSAVFLDYDRDGHMDLYVGNYLEYDPDYRFFHVQVGFPGPLAYAGQQDRLFKGNGDGTFTDVTEQSGIVIEPLGRAMGVGSLDYDNDSHPDVFVSNDSMENFLLRNKGDGTFEEVAFETGVAFGANGESTAAMAVEVSDYDDDGYLDIIVPDMRLSSLYARSDGRFFSNITVQAGIARPSRQYHSWGAVFGDLDLDGHVDLYVSNGSVERLDAHEDLLFLGDGQGGFREVSAEAGDWVKRKFVSRGAVGGDFDNDGDIDLLIASLNDRPVLLRNDTPRRDRHWLAIQLVGRGGNREAVGSFVRVVLGDRVMTRYRTTGGSYASQHDPRLHFGLGDSDSVDRVEITWPDGTQQTVTDVQVDRVITIRQPETDAPSAGP